MKINVVDPSSHKTKNVITNLGDLIIKESIEKFLENIDIDFNWVGYDQKVSGKLIIGGANVLSKNPWNNNSCWNPIPSIFNNNKVYLLGVGWWQYQSLNYFTKKIYNYTLNNQVHSVRDSYTLKSLRKCNLNNVINTSCPTTWNIENTYNDVSSVILTLTDYNQSFFYDRELIKILLQRFHKRYFWPQGLGDLEYLHKLGFTNEFEILERSLEGYDECLSNNNPIMVGTRLHAGIRALQKKCKTLILEVDNRAIEISKDINLPTVDRFNLKEIETILDSDIQIKLKLKKTEIDIFKNEFHNDITC